MAKRKQNNGTGRIGRPKRPDAGNYAHVGFGLRVDLLAYARAKASEEHRSLSSAVSHLIELGVASEVARRDEGSP